MVSVADMATFSEKLTALFHGYRGKGGEVSDRILADYVSSHVDKKAERVGYSLVNQWRHGTSKASPRLSQLKALAKFFDVPLVYLVCDEFDSPEQCERLVGTMQVKRSPGDINVKGEDDLSPTKPGRHGIR